MATKKPTPKPDSMTFEDLAELRRKSESISQFLGDQLTSLVQTLRPLLTPERLLGKYAGGREEVAGGSRALAHIKELYAGVCGQPYVLPRELDPDWLVDLSDRIDIHPWTYTYQAGSGRDARSIAITSPVTWTLHYRGGYAPDELRAVLAGHAERRADAVRRFVLQSLVLVTAFDRNPGIGEIFNAMHYSIKPETVPGLGELPVMTVRSAFSAFRPPDDLLLTAIGLSGIPAFHELVDLEAAASFEDPIHARIAALL